MNITFMRIASDQRRWWLGRPVLCLLEVVKAFKTSQAPSPRFSFLKKDVTGQVPHERGGSFFNRKTGKDEN
jgi:hypothetical protein